jgi:hypothetical protein
MKLAPDDWETKLRCASECRILDPSGDLAILLARVTALCFLSSAIGGCWDFKSEQRRNVIFSWNRFTLFFFTQKKNGDIVILNLNHSVFALRFSKLSTSFHLTRKDLFKIGLLVEMLNYVMPYWKGDMNCCPTKKYHTPRGLK